MYADGCIPTLVNEVKKSLSTIGEVAIAVGIVEVFWSFYLYKNLLFLKGKNENQTYHSQKYTS